jgi:hypothetical protein
LVSTVQEFKTLKFGRDDLNRAREDVFTREQASSEERFYTIVGPGGFKVAIFDWLDDVKARALKGDRIVIVFCAHGSEDGCVVLNTQDEKEYLSRTGAENKTESKEKPLGMFTGNEAHSALKTVFKVTCSRRKGRKKRKKTSKQRHHVTSQAVSVGVCEISAAASRFSIPTPPYQRKHSCNVHSTTPRLDASTR